MTSSALVGLNAFLSSHNLLTDGLSGLLLIFYGHDALPISCFWVSYENAFTIQKKTYIVYLLSMLSFYLKYGIFMHFKCFLTNKHILNTLMSQKKFTPSLRYIYFCHTKLLYPPSNDGLVKKR